MDYPKSMRALKYGIPFVFLATAPLGFLLGGAWSFFTLAVLPWRCSPRRGVGDRTRTDVDVGGLTYRLLPWIYIGLQIAVYHLGCRRRRRRQDDIRRSPRTDPFGGRDLRRLRDSGRPTRWCTARSRGNAALASTLLATVGYMHFRIAHIHGHHVRGATFDDPATARAPVARTLRPSWSARWPASFGRPGSSRPPD